MNKNFLSKNVLGLAFLTVAVMLIIGFVVASDSNKPATQTNTQTNSTNTANTDEAEVGVDQTTDDSSASEAPRQNTDLEETPKEMSVDDGQETEPAEEVGPINQVLNANAVAKHDTAGDCWTIVNDKAYDITDYIQSGKHPGGDEILRACGANGTSLFTTGATEDGEQIKRAGHSTSAEIQLEPFLLGEVTD